MTSGLSEMLAGRCAEEVLAQYEIGTLPVSPSFIAQSEGIALEALPGSTQGISGVLMRINTAFAIAYATYLDNDGFQRFSIAHELGHYFLPGHPEALLADGLHQSEAGFVSGDRYELEADSFAASLLMPRTLFDNAVDQAHAGLDAVETLAERCGTSLTATAIRYAQRSPDAVAVIMSTGRNVDYCFVSEPLREVARGIFLKKGAPIPGNTLTGRFNADAENVMTARREEGVATLQDWFGTTVELELCEEIAGLGRYGRTLTILTAEEIPDPEEMEEERELAESWTPRFRR